MGNKIFCTECDETCMRGIFNKEDFLCVDENKSEISFKRNEHILKQGAFVSQLIYLKKGVVKIVLEGNQERNAILNIIEERNFIGFPILGNPDIYSFSVVALTDCEVCFIRKDSILEVMKRNVEANSYLLKWFSDDYIFMYNKLATLSTCNSYGKLASVLLYLTKGVYKADILNMLSRKELAEFAAISLESSNKILLQLKHDKIIDINKEGISIKRRDLIELLSTRG